MSPLVFALLALDMGGAVRDLVRNVTAAVAHDPVVLNVRNLSSLPAADAADIRHAFESELHGGGSSTVEVRLTISENLTEYLLVAELRRGEQREVLLTSWPRSATAPAQVRRNGSGFRVDTIPLWEQEDPILDVAQSKDARLVLDARRVLLVRGGEQQAASIPAINTWPKDMRGRLSFNESGFKAWLPGVVCAGDTQPQLTLDCHESQDSWPVAPGASASLAPGRNIFEGRLEITSWGTKNMPPFYSAANAGDTWILAGGDGWAHLYGTGWQARPSIDRWGSDVAGISTPCGARVLATRATGEAEADAVQAYEVIEGTASTVGSPIEFHGPITALWSSGGTAVAVSHDLRTGRYAAFSLAPICGP
ncbi:MAG: hypothetical protein U0Q18_27285 [Bryobacteraceae bacterium]